MPSSDSRQRLTAIVAAIILLVVMVAVSPDFGFTWDERFQQRYGEQIWDYYHGRIPRSDFDTTFGNQYLYGGLVEILSVAAQHALPGMDVYVVRHMVVAVFGWLAVVFCGLTAARAFGARAGWFAAGLLALSPRFFGDAMNNPKDAPFAALTMAALYFILHLDWRPPHFSWAQLAKITVVIALAVNVRPLGLMLLGYFGAALLLAASLELFRAQDRRRWFDCAGAIGRLLAVSLVAIPAGTITWPWAQAAPLVRPIEAFLISTRLDWASGFEVLYGGELIGAGHLPWHYVPYWLVMALPPVVLAGGVLSVLAWRGGFRARTHWIALSVFALTPVAGAIWRHATIYDGIRHVLFIVPPLTALAGGGWSAALLRRSRWSVAAIAVLIIGAAEPLIFQIQNHPNQIVYFSPITGGPKAAFARYEMDYWGNSMLQAVDWSSKLARDLGVPLGVSGNPIQAIQADAGRYHTLWVTGRDKLDFHLDIRLLRGPPDALREFSGRPDVLYRVTTADGTPLCVVLPGPAYPSLAARLSAR